MRELKEIKDYAKEIHDILSEEYSTDIPEGQINHILDVATRRILEGLKSYRYINIHPFYFYFRRSDLHNYRKGLKKKHEIIRRLYSKQSSE